MKEIALWQVLRLLSWKRLWNFCRVELSLVLSKILKRAVVWGNPYILTVEPASVCNLKCPLCATGTGQVKRKEKFLDFNKFRKILDELGDSLQELLLFNQGEPFLHPQLVEMVRLAKGKKIYTTISTNGHFLNELSILNELVLCKLDVLIVSLDGASTETFHKYRQNGDLNKVVSGLRLLQQVKHEKQSRCPRVFIQFLVLRQNEHEIPAVRQLAQEVGADRILLKSVQIEKSTDAEHFLPLNPQFQRYELVHGRLQLKRKHKIMCPRLWRSSVILSDGSVTGCCFDKDGQFILGYLDKSNFEQIWRAHEYQRTRNQTLQKRSIGNLCTNCTEGIKIYH